MIKVEEIAEKYKGYEVDEEKLKEFLTPPKPKTVWDLKESDKYWYISDYGQICKSTWTNFECEIIRRAIGNCFLTKKEGEFEVERRKVETILLKYGRREYKSKDNYYMYCDYYQSPSIEINWCGSAQNQGTIYYDTKELLDQAIEEAGEDNIKKYIFGVDAG
ncbi:hypothetical protein LI033_06040 [bacterium TM223]|jgi:hypothetical protein|uniref:hypothetical protein n=1 Tax=Faecalibacillus intestinalis TaxID=1982626 RepID=UPI00210BB649|nr:hypothetical protein [Faecalibacillus intestinalis]MCB7554093.1 hypothetical protein [bacterium TM223]MCQ4767048.1 hypothetical protein [Faecalibacillus intestinalis]